MIAIDTPVLIAILLDEPERETFNRVIAYRQPAHLSAASLQEAGMIMRKPGGRGRRQRPIRIADGLAHPGRALR